MEMKNYSEVIEYLESRSVTELETIAIEANNDDSDSYDNWYDWDNWYGWDPHDKAKKVRSRKRDDALVVRRRKLNNAFEWTSTDCERLLYVNNQLLDIFEKLKNCTLNIMQQFRLQIDDKNDLLSKLWIHADIASKIYSIDRHGNPDRVIDYGIEVVLMDICTPKLSFSINESSSNFIEFSLNWNIGLFNGHFSEHYISYAMYQLAHAGTFGWSLPDILRINRFDVSLSVSNRYDKSI
jgi:hypothetical protein